MPARRENFVRDAPLGRTRFHRLKHAERAGRCHRPARSPFNIQDCYGITTTVVNPVTPSDVARMTTGVPGAATTPVTTPVLALILAIAGLSLLHTTGRPVSTA